jgi:hypothetical protein
LIAGKDERKVWEFNCWAKELEDKTGPRSYLHSPFRRHFRTSHLLPWRESDLLPHFYAENVSLPELCQLHGWTIRQESRRIFDAFIISNELDLLDIRFHELLPYVTKFVVVENERTFPGRPKTLHFQENREKFDFLGDRLRMEPWLEENWHLGRTHSTLKESRELF